jgi:cell division protein FtsI/penicillin-binding protein 2
VFDRRLRIIFVAIVALTGVVLVRLVQVQLVQAGYYREQTRRALVLAPVTLPFIRGSILDRAGTVLAHDAPCWDIKVDYSVLALQRRHIVRWTKWWRSHAARHDTAEQAEGEFLAHVDRMWRDLAIFAAEQPDDHPPPSYAAGLEPPAMSGRMSIGEREGRLRERAAAIHQRVQRIRRIVWDHRGFDAEVAEERESHAIVEGLDHAAQVDARERFEWSDDGGPGYPWVHVVPSSRRAYGEGSTPLAHVLGRMGRVDAEDIVTDPEANDPLARYLGDEMRGISGAEHLAEQTLRGRRGRVIRDRTGASIEDVPAVHGRDVVLTISAALQRRLYDLLADAVEAADPACGGAIVVLDVRTREVLALVSYPAYDPTRFDEDYQRLADDTVHVPLLFRAVADHSPPGSILKPLICLCGLNAGLITPQSVQPCTGYLFDEHPDRWRCWEIHGTSMRQAHGSIDMVGALRESCNVYMYRLGEDLGVDRITSWFDMVGVGRRSGIGLREETPGINPTPSYLATTLGRPVRRGDARNYAIGGGEVSVTPVQAANLVATYADGRFRPVTLIRGEPGPEWELPGSPTDWNAIRRGMYEVVNHPEGTAYAHAHWINEDHVLCGKTGSATVFAAPVAYRIPFIDSDGQRREEVVAERAGHPAVARFTTEHPDARVLVDEVATEAWWPPVADAEQRARERFSHAWFGGFLQPRARDGGPDWGAPAAYAFAVLVEYGGSGGRVSGPIARGVADAIIEVLGPGLEGD